MYSSEVVLAFIQLVMRCSQEDYDFDDDGQGEKFADLIESEATQLFGNRVMHMEIVHNNNAVFFKFAGDDDTRCGQAADHLLEQAGLEYTTHNDPEFPHVRFIYLLTQQKVS